MERQGPGPCARPETSAQRRARARARVYPALRGAGDLRRRDADARAFVQDLVGAGRQAVDADQKVLGFTVGQLLLEQLLDRGAVGDVEAVGEAAAVVVDEQDSHSGLS